jgi:thymidine kinase
VSQCSEDIWRDKLNEELSISSFSNENVDIRFASADDVVVFKGRCEICGRKTSNRALRYLDNKLDIEKNNKEFITDNKANVKYVPICNYCRLNLTYKGK